MAFGLYVHWPFCESKCPYCDFNSHVVDRVDTDAWTIALVSEIRRVASTTSEEILQTIFFGGGTPSLMAPKTVAAVISAATSAWRTANDLEITMEANPGSVEADRFAAYRTAGVNRVSLGIQSLDDRHLRFLGRKHSVQDATRAIDIAQRTFSRVNLDLIYARQHQTLTDWQSELHQAIRFGTDHLSLYQLTIEDGTVFARRASAGVLPGLPEEDLAVDMFELTQSVCSAAGMPAYEVSNHARSGQESRHNLIYWTGGAYAGVGPGAHGRLGHGLHRQATEALRLPSAWLESVQKRQTGELPAVVLTPDDIRDEALLMGLRISDGVPLDRLFALGIDVDRWPALDDLRSEGYLLLQDGHLRTTKSGRMLLNQVISRLSDTIPIRQS